jgi:sterol desaturase/sphingolipid hydroxylase (fatty acid hydroxylase superfamily)
MLEKTKALNKGNKVKKQMMNCKGQQAIVGLIIGFMLVAVFAIMLSPLISFIELGINATTGTTNGTLVATIFNMIPVFMALMILVAIVLLITGQR